MTHWRRVAREAARDRLRGAGTLAGTRVYAERILRLSTRTADQYPCVCVYVPSDDGSRGSDASSFGTRATIEVAIFATGAAADGLTAEEVAANTRDDLCDEVESVLLGDGVWAQECGLKATTRLATRTDWLEGEILITQARITLTCELDAEIAPRATIGPLAVVTLTNDNVIADETIDTYDEIEIPQEA